jgi:hypothetical protein
MRRRVQQRMGLATFLIASLCALAACGGTVTVSDTGSGAGGGTTSATTTTGSTTTGTTTTGSTTTTAPPPPPPASTFNGTWTGTEQVNGSSYQFQVDAVQCGNQVYASFFGQVGGSLPNTPQDVGDGTASGNTVTIVSNEYLNKAPFAQNTWVLTLVSSTSLHLTQTEHYADGRPDLHGSATLPLTSTSTGSAPDFSGTWNGHESVDGSGSYQVRFVIRQCHIYLHADMYFQVSGGLPGTPQDSADGFFDGSQVVLENVEYLNGGPFTYNMWTLTLPSADDLHYTGYRKFIDPGDTRTDQNSVADLSH